MTTDALPDHIERPELRPIQLVPMANEGKQFVALRDPAMLRNQTMVVPVQMVPVIQLLSGRLSIDEIAEKISVQREQIVELAKKLDDLGLLWGPTFKKLEEEMKNQIADRGRFPISASASLGSDAQTCREKIEEYFQQTEDPELDGVTYGIVAPHLDYDRGWPNYAAAYYAAQEIEPPDRVVILGTNHFGLGDGAIMSEYGFESPLGAISLDEKVISSMIDALGKPLIIDQLDHISEHSIELHLPWVQYCFGDVPIVAALVPDPLSDMIKDDGERVGFQEFVETMRQVLDDVGGRTFYISSSDLSHVGPQFGEPRPVDEQRRIDVERHDREMMAKFIAGDTDDFLAAFKWNKNPTRWCSIGNMAAMLTLAQPQNIELIDYRQAFDDQGSCLVSSAAMAMVR